MAVDAAPGPGLPVYGVPALRLGVHFCRCAHVLCCRSEGAERKRKKAARKPRYHENIRASSIRRTFGKNGTHGGSSGGFGDGPLPSPNPSPPNARRRGPPPKPKETNADQVESSRFRPTHAEWTGPFIPDAVSLRAPADRATR
jgi:hypothetical protein